MLRLGVLALACLASTVSCYSPKFTGCAIACTENNCPAGLTCVDGFCRGAGSDTCSPGDSADGPGDGDGGDVGPPARLFTSITTGLHHACAIGVDEQLYCWGSNDHGQIASPPGLGQQVGVHVQVIGVARWIMVSAGGDHTCGIGEDASAQRRIYCWGRNNSSECGQGGAGDVVTPLPIAQIPDPVYVSAGQQHTCAINSDSELLCWGSNDKGRLGNPVTTNSTSVPVEVANGGAWLLVAAGQENTCGKRMDGSVACWGRNSSGQVGNGLDNNVDVTVPTDIDTSIIGTGSASDLDIGFEHACMIQSVPGSGPRLRCWGDNGVFQVGVVRDATDEDEPVPVAVEGFGQDPSWRDVDLGDGVSCAVNNDGKIYCWGLQTNNALGDGCVDCRPPNVATHGPDPVRPVLIVPSGVANDAFAVAASDDFACGLWGDPVSGGVARCWGSNSHGNLGNSGISRVDKSTRSVEDGPWKTVRMATHFGCGVKLDGTVWCWGENDRKQVLPTPQSLYVEPRPVQIPTITTAIDVALGNNHACALVATSGANAVRCWGSNGSNELGTNAAGDIKTPTLVNVAGKTWESIHAGVDATCVTATDGEIQCWGQTNWLNGSATTTPLVVSPEISGTQLRLGTHNGCVIQNGDLVCWGAYDRGFRGDGNSSGDPLPPTEPVLASPTNPISGPITASDTDPFGRHRCAVNATQIFCWGSNDQHQVDAAQGDQFNMVARDLAVKAPTSPTDRTIAAGATFTVAIAADGSVHCWGDNSGMQCTQAGHTPLQFPDGAADIIVNQAGTPSTFTTIAAGEGGACAIATDQELYCWGDSPHGEAALGGIAVDQDFATTVISQ